MFSCQCINLQIMTWERNSKVQQTPNNADKIEIVYNLNGVDTTFKLHGVSWIISVNIDTVSLLIYNTDHRLMHWLICWNEAIIKGSYTIRFGLQTGKAATSVSKHFQKLHRQLVWQSKDNFQFPVFPSKV